MKLNGLNRTIRFTQNLGGSYAGLFTGASFIADFMGDDQMKAGGVTATFTRATIATVTDQDLVVREVLSGERRKGGFRRVQNLVTASESTASWSTLIGTNPPTATSAVFGGDTYAGAIFPTGGSGFSYSAGSSGGSIFSAVVTGGSVPDYTWSLKVALSRALTGGEQIQLFVTGTGGFSGFINLSSTQSPLTPTRLSVVGDFFGGAGFSGAQRIYAFILSPLSSPVSVYTKYFQAEKINGQTNQNPAEYVSVGVLSAPYQGANVDGVQYFPYLNGNTVASNVVTEARGASINGNSNFGALLGVSGDYFSTPDSPAASITGDIDIQVQANANNWTSATAEYFLSKLITGTQFSYDFALIATSGFLRFRVSPDGSAVTQYDSTVAPTVANGTTIWVRVTRVAASGLVTFYTSQDGITWVQLGNTVTTGAGNIFDGTDVLAIGAQSSGATPFAGKIYRAKIYSGINGTLKVDFNPNSWTSGANWTSATGEVWTINNNARVIPVSLGGYLPEPAATDLLLARADARDMTTANWTLGATLTRARTSIGADGVANKATRLTGGAVAATNIITTTIVAAAASRTYSVLIKRVAGANAIRLTQDNFATTFEVTALINSSTYTLVQMEQSQLNPVFGIQVGGTGDAIDVDWNQYQTGNLTGLINSRIPDTISTRNADVLTYATTGWLNAAAGTLYAEWFNPVAQTAQAVIASLNDNTPNNTIVLYENNPTTQALFFMNNGGVTQANFGGAGTLTAGAVGKAAIVWQTNDIAGWANNASMGTDAAATIPTVTQLQVGKESGSSIQLGHYVRKVAYFPYRMNSAIAQRLTV